MYWDEEAHLVPKDDKGITSYRPEWFKQKHFRGLFHWLGVTIGYRLTMNIKGVAAVIDKCRSYFEIAVARSMIARGLPMMVHSHFHEYVLALEGKEPKSCKKVCQADHPDYEQRCGQCIRIVRVS